MIRRMALSYWKLPTWACMLIGGVMAGVASLGGQWNLVLFVASYVVLLTAFLILKWRDVKATRYASRCPRGTSV